MSKILNIVYFLLLNIIVINLVYSQFDYLPTDKILEIKFEGLNNANEKEIRDIIPIKEGDIYSEANLNTTLKRLASLDIFQEAKVDLVNDIDGVILKFILVENIFIRNVKFSGNKSIGDDKIKDELQISDESYYTKYKVKNTINKIIKKYEEEGFIEVSITPVLIPVNINKNIYDLEFKINEGKKIVVERIVIDGANQISPGEIKGIMKTKEAIFILQSGVLKYEDFLQDKENIKNYYYQKGFLDVEITRYDWQIEELGNDKHKAIVVYISINEGQKYFTGKVSIINKEIDSIFSTNELYSYITLKEGDPYDKIQMELARYNIYNKYSDNGHLYANISLDIKKNPTNKIVDTFFYIYEGPKAHIENIIISGNTKTETNVIRRELLFKEGELYIQRKLRQSYEKLMQTGYFASVEPKYSPGSTEGLINLEIKVEEQRTGLFTMGMGYGTESGFNASAQISEKNLFGTGRIISFKGEYGIKRQLLELSYQEPWLFDDPTSAGISLNYSHTIYENIPVDDNYDGIIDGTNFNYIINSNITPTDLYTTNVYYKESIGLGFNIGRRFFVYWTLFGNIGFTLNRDTGANFVNPLTIADGVWKTDTGLINSLNYGFYFKNNMGIGINYNSTDHPLNPKSGINFLADFNNFGGILYGDYHYIKTRLKYSFYFNPFWQIVFAFHASSEFVMPQFFNNEFKVPTADLLYFDGIYEMRGWQYYQYIRGQSKAFYSSEIRYQIIGNELWGSLFFDIGNLWTDYNYWSFNPEGYILSFGIGFQVNIPIFPIRLYFARRGYYDKETSSFRLHQNDNLFNFIDNNGNWNTWDKWFKDWQFVLSIQGIF